MAKGQLTTELPQALGQYYDRKFIAWEKQLLRMKQFAQERPLPGNTGTTIFFTGYRPLPLQTTALTENASPTATQLEARQISATVEEWGYTVRMSKLLEMTKLDKGVVQAVELSADQAARTLDYQMTREVVRNGIWGIVANTVATDTITVTLASSASNTTSVFVAVAHNSRATWVGAVATVVLDNADQTSDRTTKYGYAGRISAYVSRAAGRDVFTMNTTAPHAAAPEAFQSGDQVRIVSQNGLTATTVMSTTFIAQAQRDLVNNRARMYGNGFYGALISPFPAMDFKRDTTWTNANQYSNIGELWRGEIGKWFGFRFVETTLPGREDTDGTENTEAGLVYHNLFFGRDSFGHSQLKGANQRLIYVVQGPDKSDALDMFSIVGWKQTFANKALTAPHAVSLMTGATA